MKHKTNSMRMLESRRIPYQAHEFSADLHSAEEAAEALGVPPSEIYKTLVVMCPGGRPVLVMAPGDKALDLKLLARAAREKKLRMATHREAEAHTGLEVGGISALALLHKRFDVYADEGILTLSRVYVSAGRKGINLSLLPGDLLRVTNARAVQVTRRDDEAVT